MHPFIGSLDFTHAANFSSAIDQFLTDRSIIWNWFSSHWSDIISWLQQPHVLAVIAAWWITFTIILTLLLTLGFGPSGIVLGSFAAAFQSWMYGGFTPVGGLFATLTSVAMLGFAMPVFAAFAIILATGVAFVVWECGAGR